MKGPKEVFGQLKSGYLRLYYFILFAYHLRMYKNAVKNAESGINTKKIEGKRNGS